jgi:hypothetical protein
MSDIARRQGQAMHDRSGCEQAVDDGERVGDIQLPPGFRDFAIDRQDPVGLCIYELFEP